MTDEYFENHRPEVIKDALFHISSSSLDDSMWLSLAGAIKNEGMGIDYKPQRVQINKVCSAVV